MSKVELSVSCFNEGYSCSQAVLSTYSEELGLDRETALKVSGGFGGGMGRMGDTCGALTGVFMVIGLKYRGIEAGNNAAKIKTDELVKEAADRFKSKNGTIFCRELLDCDISTPEGDKLASEKGLFAKTCPGLVKNAAEIIEEIM